jgi:nuclear pore complex protein Nup50
MFADKKNTSSDSSKPVFQFGGNNVIFGGKKDAPVDSSKPFQFGPNNGIFGDKKTTSGDSSNPFQFGANNGFPTSNAPSIFSSVGQSFNPQSPPLFSMNQQSVLPGIFSDFFLCCLLHTYDGLILGQG